MADNKGAVIFLAIIAVAGLGLSGFMFINDQFLGGDENTHEGLQLVALWDELNENLTSNPLYSTTSNFLIEFQEQRVLDSNYLNVINNNTRIHFLVPGLYKINLNIILYGADDTYSTYWVYLMCNGTEAGYFLRLENKDTVANPMAPYYYESCSLYVNATSSADYYEIRANGYNDFSIATDGSTPYFNQLSIEYVMD